MNDTTHKIGYTNTGKNKLKTGLMIGIPLLLGIVITLMTFPFLMDGDTYVTQIEDEPDEKIIPLNAPSKISDSDGYNISAETDYGLTENIVYVTIQDNTYSKKDVNVTFTYKDGDKTKKLSHEDFDYKANVTKPVYGLVNETLGKWKENNTITENGTTYYEYLDDNGTKLCREELSENSTNTTLIGCDYILDDNSVLKEETEQVDTKQVPEWVDVNSSQETSKENTANKIQFKNGYLPLGKVKESNEIELKVKVEHPMFDEGYQVEDEQNKYNITVTSSDGKYQTVLDPTWWNSTYDERYPHNDSGSGWTGVGHFKHNTSLVGDGWYGYLGDDASSYHDTDTGDWAVANETTELCWYNSTDDTKFTGNCEDNWVAHYTLDRNSGDVQDWIGNNDGTNNGSTRGVTGQVGDAFDFDGTDDYVISDSNIGITSNNPVSMSLWVNTDGHQSGSTYNRIIETGTNSADEVIGFMIDSSESLYVYAHGGNAEYDTGEDLTVGNWNMITLTYDGSTLRTYIDGSETSTSGVSATLNIPDSPLYLARKNYDLSGFYDGTIDDVRIYDTTLGSTEVSNLYSSTSSSFPTLDSAETESGLSIDLQKPIDNANLTTNDINFSANVSAKGVEVQNVSLKIDGTINQTNSSGVEGNYTFNETLNDGDYNWSIEAYDNESTKYESEVRDFNVLTEIKRIKANIEEDIIYNYGDNATLNYTIEDEFLDSCWYNYNDTNTTLSCTSGVNGEENITTVKGYTNVTVYANDTAGNTEKEVTSFEYDSTAPNITIENPSGTLDYNAVGENETLNTTVTDTNLDSCWYYYNGTNTSFSCSSGVKQTELFELVDYGYNQNLTVYANDSLGNTHSNTTNWEYNILQNSITYNDQALELSEEEFKINITHNPDITPSGFLVYDGESYSANEESSSGNEIVFSRSIITPNVSSKTNKTFHWNFQNGIDINSYDYIQTVDNLAVDDCSSYSNKLYEMTLYDEGNSSEINATADNSEIETEVLIYPRGEFDEEYIKYNESYNEENPVSVCTDEDVGTDKYSVSMVTSYKSDGRVKEFYYIDRKDLTNKTNNIGLYELKLTDSTSFLFNYFDEAGLTVEDAMVHVYRKYTGEGTFKEVERSKSDRSGDAVVHLVEEDVIYYFEITKYGEVLYTTGTKTALCKDTPCTIQVEASPDAQKFPRDWDLVSGGGYTIQTDEENRDVILNYEVNESRNFSLSAYEYESDGEYSLIEEKTDTGRSGSITVHIPQSAGNTTFFTVVKMDGGFIDSQWVDFTDDPQDKFGITLSIFLTALIVLTLGLMAVSEGAGTLVMVIFGLAISGFLGLITTSLSTGTNILIYLIIAGGILLWRVSTGGRG